jgi:pimeloyl-ACP methyl ester carboxylesterase
MVENEALAGGADAAPVCCGPALDFAEARARFHAEACAGICDTGRYRCRFYVWGVGPDVLFIPGLCDDSLSFVLPMARLSRQFRCIAYDLPTGEHDGANLPRYRHADYVADVFALLDHLGSRTTYLFGSSFGSTMALVAMHGAPARFPRVVLQGGFAHRPLAWAEVMLASWARWWPGAMHRLPGRLTILERGHRLPFTERPRQFWDCFLERSGAPPMRAVAHRARVLHQLDLRELLPRIAQPTLLICGELDPLVARTCEDTLLCGLPNARRVVLPRGGHVPQFSHPEMLAELTSHFLRTDALIAM